MTERRRLYIYINQIDHKNRNIHGLFDSGQPLQVCAQRCYLKHLTIIHVSFTVAVTKKNGRVNRLQ